MTETKEIPEVVTLSRIKARLFEADQALQDNNPVRAYLKVQQVIQLIGKREAELLTPVNRS